MYFYIVIFLIFGGFGLTPPFNVEATITVISGDRNESKTIFSFEDEPARFIPDRISFYGLEGFLLYANPANACSPVVGPGSYKIPSLPPEYETTFILLTRRRDCDFQTKIEHAQEAGFSAIIVHNVGSNSTESMELKDPSKIRIYACFVGEYSGLALKNYTNTTLYYISIQDDFSMSGYLLPFAIIVGVCFLIMIAFMVRVLWTQVTRWLRERRRSRRRKLPASALKKLPVQKFVLSDPYETCVICLDDFKLDDKLRILPCSHGFHIGCIDPWLTKGRRVCPICKRKVVLADEHFSEPDTDSDDDETSPLLPQNNNTTPNVNNLTTTSLPNINLNEGQTDVVQNIRENPLSRFRRRIVERRIRRVAERNAHQRLEEENENDNSSVGSSESSSNSENVSVNSENIAHQNVSVSVSAEVHSNLALDRNDNDFERGGNGTSNNSSASSSLESGSISSESPETEPPPSVYIVDNNNLNMPPSTATPNQNNNNRAHNNNNIV